MPNKTAAPSPVVKTALANYATKNGLQVEAGFKPQAPGFGRPADEMARRVQRHAGLKADGQVGMHTMGVLVPYLPKPVGRTRGAQAANWLSWFVGEQEQYGKNDGPVLRALRIILGDHWMKGQPYCAWFGVDGAYKLGANMDLGRLWPGVNWAYCPSIESAVRNGTKSADGKWKLVRVGPHETRAGNIVLFEWQGDGESDHVGLALGPAVNSLLPCVEANTPPSDGGDQSGLGSGDGVWHKRRDLGRVSCIGRIVAA